MLKQYVSLPINDTQYDKIDKSCWQEYPLSLVQTII